MSGKAEVETGASEQQWPHINEEVALTVKNAAEQRKFGTLAYQIKCKWENQVKKGDLSLGERENLLPLPVGSFIVLRPNPLPSSL
jgi:hypothetical protein